MVSPLETRRSLVAAGTLALVIHALLGFWLERWHLPRHQVVRVEQARKFELKRVQLRPGALQATRPAADWAALPLARDAVVRAVPVADQQAIEQALQAVRPQVVMPTAETTAAPLLEVIPSGASAVETLSARPTQEQAMIREEIGRLSAATLSPGSAPGTPATPSGLSETTGGGTRGGLSGPATPGEGVPAFDDLRAQFRDANTLGPRLPEPVLVRLPSDVVFDFDSGAIRQSAMPLLQQALNLILRYPRARVQVDGHTDTFGADDYNQELSERRATNVAEWLREQLPEEKQSAYDFTARGYGKTRPLVNVRGSIAEQERNRRVELVIQPLGEAR